MKANLIIEINELALRGLTLIEEEGIMNVLSQRKTLSFSYEEEEEGKLLIIKSFALNPLLEFLSFTEIVVKIIT